MVVIAIDPAGNMGKEGNGITGLARFVRGDLSNAWVTEAALYETIEAYWSSLWGQIKTQLPDAVVCESYKLQAGKQMAQTWSALETPQLIGYLRMKCFEEGIAFHFQDSAIKVRWSDPILERMGIVQHLNKSKKLYYKGEVILDHARDAIRHGLHFHKYGAGK